MEFSIEKTKQYGDLLDLATKAFKVTSILGSVCGAIFFLHYTTNVGVPFPLELSVLATSLLVIGVLSIAGTFILASGTLVPALFTDNFPKSANAYFNANDRKEWKWAFILWRYFIWSWVPFVVVFLALLLLSGSLGFKGPRLGEAVSLALLGVALIGATQFRMKLSSEDRNRYYMLKFLQTIFSMFSYALSIILGALIFPELRDMDVLPGFGLILIPFTFIHILVAAPNIFAAHEKKDGRKQGAVLLTKPKAKSVMTIVFGLAGLATVYPLAVPQVGTKVGELALRALRVGGGIEVHLCTKNKPQSKILARVKFDADNCTEEPVYLLLDIGERVYVSDKWPISRLEQKKDLWGEPIYFRQDEIRQKIFVVLGPKK